MIARALLHEPPVLFLDEPTRGLDPIAAREIRSSSPGYTRTVPGGLDRQHNLGSVGSNLLDIGIVLGSTIVFLVISAWALRWQSSVLAVI